MKLSACPGLPTRPVSRTWYRAVQLRHYRSLLATSHTATIPGRFNAGSMARPGFEILYFAENHSVALFEVQALLGSPYPGFAFAPNPASSWAVVNVHARLQYVIDLTVPAHRRTIRATVQELTGDWRGYLLRNPTPRLSAPHWSNVPTQRLGHALHAIPQVEGFMTFSARVANRKNLIVFPKKLHTGSSLRFRDPVTGAVTRIT